MLIATDPQLFLLIILIHCHNAPNPTYFLFGEWDIYLGVVVVILYINT